MANEDYDIETEYVPFLHGGNRRRFLECGDLCRLGFVDLLQMLKRTAELLAALERVRPAAAEKKAAAEAKRIAREAEEEARAARALQDAAELGEGKGAPVEPEAKGGAADDFEGRAAAVVARVKAGLAMEGSAS